MKKFLFLSILALCLCALAVASAQDFTLNSKPRITEYTGAGGEVTTPAEIDGYGNEKFTHTAVAATGAAGNADAGMGIFSAAKIYGLDFIPLYHEEYDFLVGDKYLDDPMVKIFFEILQSESFRRRLEAMGGYQT